MLRDRYPDVPALLAAIRANPAMFLGRVSALRLGSLFDGIWLAEEFHRVPAADRIGGFDQEAFEAWVEARYNPRRLTFRSFTLAVRRAGRELPRDPSGPAVSRARRQEAGFILWFEWYDEFMAGGSGAAPDAEPGAAADTGGVGGFS